MANIITQTDFVGKYKLSHNDKLTEKIEGYIDLYYRQYIRRILGVTLGNAFIADLEANAGVPILPEHVEIYNAFQVDDNDEIRESIGMKNIILGFLYFEIVRDSNKLHTTAGNKTTVGENSALADMRDNLTTVYNESIKSACNVQWYVEDYNPNAYAQYADYNGQELDFLGLW